MFTLFLPLLVATMVLVIGVPAAGFAQFSGKADHVELKKGTRLCSSIAFAGIRDLRSASHILESDEPHACQWHADRFRVRPRNGV